MIKEELLDLLNNLENIDGESIEKLDELKRDHPYFQAIPILQAKIASDNGNENKKDYISKAAIYTADRKNLKDLIEDQKVIAKVVIATTEEKEVKTETISQTKPATAPSEVEKPLKEAVEEEKKKVFESSSQSSSNDLYEEVMKNLKTLRSLRQQYDFLEEKIEQEETEDGKDKKPTKKENSPKKGSAAKSTTKSTKKKKPATQKKKSSVKADKKETPDQPEPKDKEREVHHEVKTEISHRESEVGQSVKKIDLQEQNSLIDSFIKNEPQIARKKPDDTIENRNDLSEDSTKITDELVSENLADIMLSQGKTNKAIEIYKKLIWKFPQKKAYFASRIEELTKK